MLKLSKEVDYAVQLIQALHGTQKQTPRSLREIADKSNISFLFLQRIAQKLRTGGVLASKKGANGGYYLIQKKQPLSLHQLLLLIEGTDAVVQCQEHPGLCHKESNCDVRPLYNTLQKQMIQVLRNTKVEAV